MKSAIKWKAINNEIIQWKTISRAGKANLLISKFFKVSRNLGFVIFPCESPSFDVYDIFIPQVILLYFAPSPNKYTKRNNWKSLQPEKKSVRCRATYSETKGRFHCYFIIVLLKRISFPLFIILSFCLSQRQLGPKSCLTVSIVTAGFLQTTCYLSSSFYMFVTNGTITAHTRIEKDAIVVLFASSVFFSFTLSLMKNVTKKCKML